MLLFSNDDLPACQFCHNIVNCCLQLIRKFIIVSLIIQSCTCRRVIYLKSRLKGIFHNTLTRLIYCSSNIFKRRPEYSIFINRSLPFVNSYSKNAFFLARSDYSKAGLVSRMHNYVRSLPNYLLRQLTSLIWIVWVSNKQGFTSCPIIHICNALFKTYTKFIDNRLIRAAQPCHFACFRCRCSHHTRYKRSLLRFYYNCLHIICLSRYITVYINELRIRKLFRKIYGFGCKIIPYTVDRICPCLCHRANLFAVLRLVESLYYFRLNSIFFRQLIYSINTKLKEGVALRNRNYHSYHCTIHFSF